MPVKSQASAEGGQELLRTADLQAMMPEGWGTNFVDEDRLEKLNSTFVQETGSGASSFSSLDGTVGTQSVKNVNEDMTEEDVIDMVLNQVYTSFVTHERTIAIPGIEINRNLIKAAAVQFKQDTDTPSGTIKPPELASNDDIVFEVATPEVYEDITGTAQDAFTADVGTDLNPLSVVGPDGVGDPDQAAGNLSLGSNEWLVYTGDVIDFASAGAVTKYQWADVDGETDWGPTSTLIGPRATDPKLDLIPGHVVKEDVRLEAKAYEGDVAGTSPEVAEVFPIGFRLVKGSNVQPLA